MWERQWGVEIIQKKNRERENCQFHFALIHSRSRLFDSWNHSLHFSKWDNLHEEDAPAWLTAQRAAALWILNEIFSSRELGISQFNFFDFYLFCYQFASAAATTFVISHESRFFFFSNMLRSKSERKWEGGETTRLRNWNWRSEEDFCFFFLLKTLKWFNVVAKGQRVEQRRKKSPFQVPNFFFFFSAHLNWFLDED